MSRFWVSVRHARSGVGGNAWIAFHRCVENHARLTGERFTEVFSELSSRHGFGRGSKLPKPERLRAAVQELVERHECFLAELRERESERRAQKRAGRRENEDPFFVELAARRAANHPPEVGYWGWRDRR